MATSSASPKTGATLETPIDLSPKISGEPQPSARHPMLKNISKMFNNQDYSDLKIKIENKYIYVHKFVLKLHNYDTESSF